MSRTTTTTRDRGDRYDPIEWAQKSIDNLRDPKLQPSASAIQPRLWGENEFVFLAPKITTMSCELSSTRRLDCDRKCQQIGLFFGFQSVLLCFPILFIFRSTREVYSKPEGRMNRCHVWRTITVYWFVGSIKLNIAGLDDRRSRLNAASIKSMERWANIPGPSVVKSLRTRWDRFGGRWQGRGKIYGVGEAKVGG